MVSCLRHRLDTDDSCLWRRLAEGLRRLGRYEESAEAWRAASATYSPPLQAEQLEREGERLHANHHIIPSLDYFHQSINAAPTYPLPYHAAGVALFQLGRRQEAVKSMQTAVRLDPMLKSAVYTLAEALRGFTKPEHAIAIVYAGLRLDSSSMSLRCRLLLLKREVGFLEGTSELLHSITEQYFPHMQGSCVTPFDSLSLGLSPPLSLMVADKFLRQRVDRRGLVETPPPFQVAWAMQGRIRIGMTSACLTDNKLGQYLHAALSVIDVSRFSVTCFSLSTAQTLSGQQWQQAIRNQCSEFVDLSQVGDVDAAVAINQRQIHILCDVDSWNDGSRPFIGHLRPTARQVSLLNFAGSSAMPHIDWMVGDPIASPPEHMSHFSEKLALLPPSYQLFSQRDMVHMDDMWDERPRRIMRRQLGVTTESTVVALCTSQLNRIDEVALRTWAQILQKNENMVLWLTRFRREAVKHISRNLHKLGVDVQRQLVWTDPLPLEDHLRGRTAGDLGLDTPTFNGHSAVADLLYAGVPVVTYAGETMAARVAASILTALHAPHLIACTLDEYAALASMLARRPHVLGKWRADVAQGRANGRLFDSRAWTRGFEKALIMMWTVEAHERWHLVAATQ